MNMHGNDAVIVQSTYAPAGAVVDATCSVLGSRWSHRSVNLGELLVLALALGLLAVTGNVHAVTYNWTNATSSGYLTDPGNWSAPGGPGGPNDTFTYLRTGTNTVSLTNNFANIGSFQFGAGSAGQNLVLTLNFGTNTFAGLSGNNINISGFVFGQTGTTVVYIAVGTMYCTNSFSTPSNARLIIGRSSGAPATVFLTNGTVNSGNLILANNATAIPSQLVISGAGSYWSNNNTVAIGNIASANFNSLVISNSGSMTVLNALSAGLQSTSHSNSLLVDTSGQLFTRGANATFGAGGGSVGNKATVQGGGLWDNGNRGITLGAGGGSGNTLMVGNNGTVTNVTIVAIFAGNSLSLSGGVLFASIAVTNTSGTVSGFGTIAGNVVFAGTGTLTPGFGATVGTLNHSTNLTLVSGSTTTMKLDKGQAGSNDLLNVVGTLTEAGTVTINNVGAALVGGDTFQLFTFGSESGDFAVTNLPSLNGSLVWNTSQLGPQGIISVVLPPGIIGPGDQATNVGATVTISTIVTGVPVPGVQWQLGGTNLVDDPTGNGSTISGSTSSALTILNAQVADSGSYCLIASNFASTVTNCMTLTVSVAGLQLLGLHEHCRGHEHFGDADQCPIHARRFRLFDHCQQPRGCADQQRGVARRRPASHSHPATKPHGHQYAKRVVLGDVHQCGAAADLPVGEEQCGDCQCHERHVYDCERRAIGYGQLFRRPGQCRRLDHQQQRDTDRRFDDERRLDTDQWRHGCLL